MHVVNCPAPVSELRIQADKAKLHEAREWAAAIATEFGLDEEGCFAVRLAMSEAVTNAILHGSASPEDPVGIEARWEAERLVFEVSDTARRPPVDLDRPDAGGRGLGVVALVTDEMQLTCNEGGSTLRFVKRR